MRIVGMIKSSNYNSSVSRVFPACGFAISLNLVALIVAIATYMPFAVVVLTSDLDIVPTDSIPNWPHSPHPYGDHLGNNTN